MNDFWLYLFSFAYFSLKNYLIYDRLKLFTDKTRNGIFSVLLAAASIALNYYMVRAYNFNLDLTFIKGSIDLPSFTMLLILADAISTVVMILMIRFYMGRKAPSLIFEIGRIIFVYVVFTLLVTTYWERSFDSKFMNLNYICFESGLKYDIASYYCSHGLYPAHLADATDWSVNPFNNSPLEIVHADDELTWEVRDQKENTIAIAYKDFLGISRCHDNPESYLKTYTIFLNGLTCNPK